MPKNLSAKYYQDNKERLQKKACEKYQIYLKKKKKKKQQYGCEHYKNLSEDEKQKPVEYRKKSHTYQEGGAKLRISFWHLLINLKNKYL